MPPKKSRKDPAEDKKPDQQEQADESDKPEEQTDNDGIVDSGRPKREKKKTAKALDPQQADGENAIEGEGRVTDENQDSGEQASGNAPATNAAPSSKAQQSDAVRKEANALGLKFKDVLAACAKIEGTKPPHSFQEGKNILAENGTIFEALAKELGREPAKKRGASGSATNPELVPDGNEDVDVVEVPNSKGKAAKKKKQPEETTKGQTGRVLRPPKKPKGKETVDPAANGQGKGGASGATSGGGTRPIKKINAPAQKPDPKEDEIKWKEARKEQQDEARRRKRKEEDREAFSFAAATPPGEGQGSPPKSFRQPHGLGQWEFADESSRGIVTRDFAGREHFNFLDKDHPTPYEILMLRHAYRHYKKGGDPTSEIDIRWVPFVIENFRALVPDLIGPAIDPPVGFEPSVAGSWEFANDGKSQDLAEKRFGIREEFNVDLPGMTYPLAADIWRLRQNRSELDADPVTGISIVWVPQSARAGTRVDGASAGPIDLAEDDEGLGGAQEGNDGDATTSGNDKGADQSAGASIQGTDQPSENGKGKGRANTGSGTESGSSETKGKQRGSSKQPAGPPTKATKRSRPREDDEDELEDFSEQAQSSKKAKK